MGSRVKVFYEGYTLKAQGACFSRGFRRGDWASLNLKSHVARQRGTRCRVRQPSV